MVEFRTRRYRNPQNSFLRMLSTASRLFAYRNVGVWNRDGMSIRPKSTMCRDVSEEHKHLDMTEICDMGDPEAQNCEG